MEEKRRYSLVVPGDLYNEVKAIAGKRDITVAEVFRRFIKLGLLAESIDDDPERTLLIENEGTLREILLL